MSEELTIVNERVDDVPLLIAHMERMGLPQQLNACFPTHGNWEGLSLGWVATCWFTPDIYTRLCAYSLKPP